MSPASIRILGIDPGLRNTGWGIIEARGSRLSFIACGRVRSDARLNMGERLRQLHEGLMGVIADHAPHEAAIEETFVNRDPQSALKLGQARGVALTAPALAGLNHAGIRRGGGGGGKGGGELSSTHCEKLETLPNRSPHQHEACGMRILFALTIWLALASSAFSQTSRIPGNAFLGNTSGNRPANSIGSEKSWFIDTSSGGIYGPKSSAAWPSAPAATFGILTGPGGVIAPSLGKNVFGASNAGFGANALANIRLADDNAFGNVAVGVNAMFGNLTGRRSVAVGGYALHAATNTDATVAVGYGALQNYNDIEGGVAVGNQALFNSTTSLANIAIGNTSLYSLVTGGGLNVGVGHHALYSATTAGGNNVMGYESGYDVTSGSFNTLIGHNTGRGITTGSNNTIVGGQVVGLSAGLTGAVILATGDGTIRLDYNNTLPNYWFTPNPASIAGVLIQGTIVPFKYTIGTLVTCNAATLGAYSTVTDGADYATGKYGSAVGAPGAVTRKVLCTNTGGPTMYAWAYD